MELISINGRSLSSLHSEKMQTLSTGALFLIDKVIAIVNKIFDACSDFFINLKRELPFLLDKIVNPKHKRSPIKELSTKGIPNLGNTCYMATCVKAIAGNDLLFEMFKNSKGNDKLKNAMLTLIYTTKNSKAKRNDLYKATKNFQKALEESSWQKGDKRLKGFRSADAVELLSFLQEQMKVKNHPVKINRETTIVTKDYKTGQIIRQEQKEPQILNGFTLYLDEKTTSVQKFIDNQFDIKGDETLHLINEDKSIGKEIDEREVLFSFVSKMKEGKDKDTLLNLFQYDEKNKRFKVPSNLFRKGSYNFNILVKKLEIGYEMLEKQFCENSKMSYCKCSNSSSEVVDQKSKMLMVTIENPNKDFNPDRELEIDGRMFKLSGAMKRPGGNHYTYLGFENNRAINFNDDKVSFKEYLALSRVLFYTEVK